MNSTIRLLIFCLLTVSTIHVFAQQQEGTLIYETKVDMHRRLGPDQQQMKNVLPEFRTTKQQLAFNPSESLYKPLEDEETDTEMSSGNVRMSFRTPYSEQYFNSAASKKVSLLEFQGKDYLVSDSVKVLPWKFGSETKTILGYTCKQAFYTDENQQQVIAWYTESLRPMLGPANYNSLPGTVLQVDVNNGEQLITALKLDPKKPRKHDLSEPAKGQKISRADYQKMVNEQVERMRQEGGRVIRF